LLGLLQKLTQELDKIEQGYSFDMPEKYFVCRKIIQKVLFQQRQLFTAVKKPQARIVSLSKSYIRPIVRGKNKTGRVWG